MSAPASLIPELEEVIQHGSPERRAETLKRITAFFLDGASRFNDDHVRLFDQVFSRLIAEIEAKARTELSLPPRARRQCAGRSGAATRARRRHRGRGSGPQAIAADRRNRPRRHRPDQEPGAPARHLEPAGIAEPVTDVLVRRGDHEVVRRVAENRGARFSDDSFSKLVGRAEKDGVLAEKVGLRPDIPPRLFRDLLLKATEVVQQRLFASAKPETQAEIRRVLAKVSNEVGASAAPRDYSAAQRAVEALRREGKLDEAALVDFAKKAQYEETIAALACALLGADRGGGSA